MSGLEISRADNVEETRASAAVEMPYFVLDLHCSLQNILLFIFPAGISAIAIFLSSNRK